MTVSFSDCGGLDHSPEQLSCTHRVFNAPFFFFFKHRSPAYDTKKTLGDLFFSIQEP